MVKLRGHLPPARRFRPAFGLFCNLVSSLVLLGLDYIRLLGRLASTFSLCLSYVSGEILL